MVTLDKEMLAQRLGRVDRATMNMVEIGLRRTLALQ